MTADVSVIILTHNEALHIERAIASLRPFARDIFIIDSFSDDGTPELARAAGATVLQNKWVNHSTQFAWGMSHAPITTTWIMRLDADEVVGPDLAEEINSKLPGMGDDVVGITLDRRHIFMDRWIKHGGRFPLTLLRIWRSGHGRIESRWMDEHIVVHGGRTVAFRGAFSDWNLKDLTFFTAKHNSYATREAIDILAQKYQLLEADKAIHECEGMSQASWRRFMKEDVYNRLPFWVSTTGYFFFRYVIQLGFLDGSPGLIYHFLQAYWYRFLVGAKVREYELGMTGARTTKERLDILSALTGHDLRPPLLTWGSFAPFQVNLTECR